MPMMNLDMIGSCFGNRSASEVAKRFGWRNMPRDLIAAIDTRHLEARLATNRLRDQLDAAFAKVRAEREVAEPPVSTRPLTAPVADDIPYGTCLHEAGHAAGVLSVKCRVSALVANSDGSGRCEWTGRATLRTDQAAMVSFCGAAAQGEPFHNPTAASDREFVLEDMREQWDENNRAREAAFRMPLGEPNERQLLELASTAHSWAFDVVDEQSRFIKAVANRLQLTGRMSGAEVHDFWDRYKYEL